MTSVTEETERAADVTGLPDPDQGMTCTMGYFRRIVRAVKRVLGGKVKRHGCAKAAVARIALRCTGCGMEATRFACQLHLEAARMNLVCCQSCYGRPVRIIRYL